MRDKVRSQQRLAVLAARQYGVVSSRQLVGLGYSRNAIRHAVATSRLHRAHRGVYAVGHSALSPHGRCLAAVLACGRGAVLSHESAGWLWGFLPRPPVRAEVTVPSRGHRRGGIHTHHSISITSDERGELEEIPVTSAPRTLLDLAPSGPAKRLERAVERAERLGHLDLIDIDAILRRRAGAPGAKRLFEALDIYRDPAFSRARSELLFLDLIKKARLPRPAINTYVCGHEVDAYWEEERFAVEVDGWGTHQTRVAFESDPLRQENLKLAGIDSIRITARRIEREPQHVAERLGRLLTQRRHELGR
jgi:predicted transcriptional regulator of viral defense system/very-short-patch-repair endonuclease